MDELGALGPEPSDADLAADEEVGEPPTVGELFAYLESPDEEERADGQGLRRNLSFGSSGQRGSAPRRSGGSPPPPPGEPPRRSPSFERSPSSHATAAVGREPQNAGHATPAHDQGVSRLHTWGQLPILGDGTLRFHPQ